MVFCAEVIGLVTVSEVDYALGILAENPILLMFFLGFTRGESELSLLKRLRVKYTRAFKLERVSIVDAPRVQNWQRSY